VAITQNPRACDKRHRPITDRVKQSLFDMLTSASGTPGHLPDITVADVFAGGGTLGLEALSRGARLACFFERNKTALDTLEKNISALDAHAMTTIISGDVWRRLPRKDLHGCVFNLVFFDPPFDFTREARSLDRLCELLRRLAHEGIVAGDARAVFRHEPRIQPKADALAPWHIEQQRRMGENVITLLSLESKPAPSQERSRLS